MSYIDEYIASCENKNTAKVSKSILKHAPDGFENFDLDELYAFILDLAPKSERHIKTICNRVKAYAKWLDENNIVCNNPLLIAVQNVNKNLLWEQAKSTAEGKFISFEQYQSIIRRIRVEEGYNPLYYEVLFRSIYEGIYNDDLSVLKNLRRSDINGNIITLRDDKGNTYQLKVSEELARQLEQLSTINIWYRPNRNGICEIDMTGIYPDSIFMSEKRNNRTQKSLRFSYYNKLRDIQDNYVGYALSPLNLCISGLVHRIKYLLDKNNLSINEAFADNARSEIVHTIVSNELIRCNEVMRVENFRDHIKGHIDVFLADSTEDVSEQLFETITSPTTPDEYLEGEELLVTHRSHERNAGVVNASKALFKANHQGRLFCEVCGFDFKEKYGERGADFIEAHHAKPIAARNKNEPTKVEDIVLLCSNCHSIIHRKQPWLSILQLKQIIK